METLTFVIIAYFAVVAFIYVRQSKMLYFPHDASRTEEEGRARHLGLRLWPDGSEDYHGFVSTAAPGKNEGTILLFHGNAGSALDRSHYAEEIRKLGFRVILFEYPGYGARPGALNESAFVEAAKRAVRAAAGEFGRPVFVFGESLGCGIATAVAGNSALGVEGALLVTPWDTLPNLAQSMYWFLPAKWMVKDKYDNSQNLRGFKGPVAVVMATGDEIVPNKHTKKMFALLEVKKKRLWVLEGGHNNWLTAVNETWWQEIMRFVTGSTPKESGQVL